MMFCEQYFDFDATECNSNSEEKPMPFASAMKPDPGGERECSQSEVRNEVRRTDLSELDKLDL